MECSTSRISFTATVHVRRTTCRSQRRHVGQLLAHQTEVGYHIRLLFATALRLASRTGLIKPSRPMADCSHPDIYNQRCCGPRNKGLTVLWCACRRTDRHLEPLGNVVVLRVRSLICSVAHYAHSRRDERYAIRHSPGIPK